MIKAREVAFLLYYLHEASAFHFAFQELSIPVFTIAKITNKVLEYSHGDHFA